MGLFVLERCSKVEIVHEKHRRSLMKKADKRLGFWLSELSEGFDWRDCIFKGCFLL